MLQDAIVDIEGIKVGHATNLAALTGCTIILCEQGCTASIDIRGGAPGTREVALLDPHASMNKIHGIMLAGGSAFGLEAACGAMNFLEEKGVGIDVGLTKVPIVASAILFDLTIGDYKIRPDKQMGYNACKFAKHVDIEQGSVGAGTGASVGKILGIANCMKSGIGTASIQVQSLVVGAIIAVNAFGDVYDPETNNIIAGALRPDRKGFANTIKMYQEGSVPEIRPFLQNTTIGVVGTNAELSKVEVNKVCQMAHHGYARSIRPAHTMFDGDAIFGLATGDIKADVTCVGVLAAEVTARAIVKAVKKATSL